MIEEDSRIEFPKIRGSFLGAPMMSIGIFCDRSFCALPTGLMFLEFLVSHMTSRPQEVGCLVASFTAAGAEITVVLLHDC